jgi:alpha-L-fucosidase
VGDWFYSPGFTYDAGSVIRCLLEYVSRDGSYAVCVSQQPDGSLDEGSRDMLKGIGDWLRVNGEAIYGSKAWVTFGEGRDDVGNIKTLPEGKLGSKQADFPFGADDIRFTVGKDGSLYAIAMAVPKGEVRVKSLGSGSKLLDKKIAAVSLLGSNAELDWKQEPDALVIQPVAKWPCQHAVAFKIAMGEKMK